jgi:hypothetical protein
MGYSDDSAMVRVDFFRPSGKWYTTDAVRWLRYRGTDDDGKIMLVQDAFLESLADHLKKHSIKDGRCKHCGQSGVHVNGASHCDKAPHRLAGMTAVCLEPHHEHACPLMVNVPGNYE